MGILISLLSRIFLGQRQQIGMGAGMCAPRSGDPPPADAPTKEELEELEARRKLFAPPVPRKTSTEYSAATSQPKLPGTGRSWSEQASVASVVAVSNNIVGVSTATPKDEPEEAAAPYAMNRGVLP